MNELVSIATGFNFRIAFDAFQRVHMLDIVAALPRHAAGDWGEVSPKTRRNNEEAVKNGGRVFSVYRDRNKVKFFITTASDDGIPFVYVPE